MSRDEICKETAELLPWLLNGRLDEEEERRLRGHLGTCATCRDELDRVRAAWDLVEGHLPTEILVDQALGRIGAGARWDLITEHLELCPRCREELRLLERSREMALEERQSPRVPADAHRRRRLPESSRRYTLLAAGLATVIAGAGWWWSIQQAARQRAAWRQQQSELEARIEALSAPRVNIPVVELLPAEAGTSLRAAPREESSWVNQLNLPAGAPEIVLVLLHGGDGCTAGCTVELRQGDGEPILRLDGLAPDPAGHFSIRLPSRFLPRGRFSIQVRDSVSGLPVGTYPVVLEQGIP